MNIRLETDGAPRRLVVLAGCRYFALLRTAQAINACSLDSLPSSDLSNGEAVKVAQIRSTVWLMQTCSPPLVICRYFTIVRIPCS